MKTLLTLILLTLIVSGCGKPKGEVRPFANAVITDVNDWSSDPSLSCSFYIRLQEGDILDEDVINVEAERDYCRDFKEGDEVSGSYIDGEETDFLVQME
ncbi:hypothetical protein AB1K32_25055 [Metabacillus dongyingensis]|uniref:hypothetical protein n=1 Tax=Metabacillus dongyingensis TaxID=2874282 RepID=UPI003B8BA33E